MYYRFEARDRKDGEWEGLCQALTPDHRRKIGRFLATPKWYDNNPDADSKCWFTQFGYEKYRNRIEEIIDDCSEWYYPLEVRVITSEKLDNIVCKGKVQCIQLISA